MTAARAPKPEDDRSRSSEVRVLERLVAIEDLRALQSRYARLADAKDWHALAELFIPDGVFEPLGVDGKPQVTMIGRAQIVSRVSSSVGEGTATHHLFSHELEIESPTAASGVWAMEDWIDRSSDQTAAAGAIRTLHGRGHYYVTYRKLDGRWFIARQTLHRTFLEITRKDDAKS